MSGGGTRPRDLRVVRLRDRIANLPIARRLTSILVVYDAAGGGLLASGLAFDALFAVLPAILLVVSIAGIVLRDPARLRSMVDQLSIAFPPLAGFFQEAMAGFADGALSFSLIGFVGLVWGSSRFYRSLDGAIARIFHERSRRNLLDRGVRGVVSVFLLVGCLVGAATFAYLAEVVGRSSPGLHLAVRLVASLLASGIGTFLVFAGAMAVIYRVVPMTTPAWSAIGRPAIAVGAAQAVLTLAFTRLAPQLVGSLQVFGAFVALFAAMLWLSLLTQAILIGAAWVHRRAIEVR